MNYFGYDGSLIVGSVCIVAAICYIALSLEHFVLRCKKYYQQLILFILSGLVFGLAIWSMHFVVIFASHFPATYSFNFTFLALSYLIATASSLCAIWLASRSLSLIRLVFSAIVMGCGTASMHYVGMFGFHIPNYELHYDIVLVLLSVITPIIGCYFSFWLVAHYKHTVKYHSIFKLIVSLMIAFNIMSTHIIAISAATLHSVDDISGAMSNIYMGSNIPLFVMICICLLIFASILAVVILDWRLEERNLQLLKANKQLENLTLQDNLTKLPNRLFLEDYIQKLFQRYKLTHQKFALIYLDVDFFKAVNDNFGYQLGDDLLVALTARLQAVLEDNQILLRLGGDEFLVILPQIEGLKLEVIAEKILEKIQQRFLIHDKQINISASLGIVLHPDHGQSLQDLLMHADTAKMLAKEQGRNTFCIYNQNSDHYFKYRHQSKLINDLYRAVEEEQFILYYQAKFTADYQVCGVEALIRWQHPSLGLLVPNKFIEAAEQTGLIIRMGYWALEQACIQLQLWHQKEMPFCPIAVNLSAMQFEHKHLISALDNLMKKYQIQANELIVEITESTAMHHIESSIRTFEHLRALGILLAIDDFGTGHSSFLYLKNLPVDELKIDREFIRNLSEGSKDEIILESIIHLAIRLGLVVTAEGVETEQQAAILKRLGCQQLQGYLLGKPMPIKCLEKKYFI